MTFRQSLRLFFLLTCVTGAVRLSAQMRAHKSDIHPEHDPRNVVAQDLNHPLDLTADWLVQAGDDLRYASPTFDDSSWTVVDVKKPLASYGFARPDYVWYRIHVHIPAGEHDLGILLRAFYGSEQVYVNGVLTGPSRAFSAIGGTIIPNYDLRSSLPDGLIASGNLTIAIRGQIGAVSKSGRPWGFYPNSAFLLGNSAALAEQTTLSNFREFASNFVNISLTALVFFIALALALTLRDEREYLALSLFLGATLAQNLLVVWDTTHEVAFNRFYDLPAQICSATVVFSGIAFARRILRLENSGWVRGYQWVLGIAMVFGATFDAATFQNAHPNHAWLLLVGFTVLIIVVPLNLGLPIFALWVWKRRRNFDALLLSVPLLISALMFYVRIGVGLINVVYPSGHITIPDPPTGSFEMQWTEITDFLFTLALLGFLILRTVRLARTRALLAAELAAAQHVQQLLLSGSSRATPGFRVETAFHPANEVGGDFFLLSPSEDGSLFAIVGDVSGKGLTAAMRVAMILGVLRRETSREPEVVLGNLNDALLSQSEMGFTTACCVHLSPEGRFVVANAGHIAPYIAGVELETEPALPLGMAEEQRYTFVEGRLAAGEVMVLMSDGVVEARDARGELYGFERLPALTILPAQAIADAAVRFGQEDDITVMTLAVA